MRHLDTNPLSLVMAGALLGIAHGVTVLLTSDINTRTISFLTTGNMYTWMYISLLFVDGAAIIGILSAIWWYPLIERIIMDRYTIKD